MWSLQESSLGGSSCSVASHIPSGSSADGVKATATAAWTRRSESSAPDAKRISGQGFNVGGMLASLGYAMRAPIARLKKSHGSFFADEDVNRKVQMAAEAAGLRPDYKLTFWGCMVAGAVSRR